MGFQHSIPGCVWSPIDARHRKSCKFAALLVPFRLSFAVFCFQLDLHATMEYNDDTGVYGYFLIDPQAELCFDRATRTKSAWHGHRTRFQDPGAMAHRVGRIGINKFSS